MIHVFKKFPMKKASISNAMPSLKGQVLPLWVLSRDAVAGHGEDQEKFDFVLAQLETHSRLTISDALK